MFKTLLTTCLHLDLIIFSKNKYHKNDHNNKDQKKVSIIYKIIEKHWQTTKAKNFHKYITGIIIYNVI